MKSAWLSYEVSFLENLEKGFIRTNMHTTLIMQEPNYRKSWNVKKHQGYDYMQETYYRSMNIEKICL
jgi:hypothetical protein